MPETVNNQSLRIEHVLRHIGLNEKEIKIYLALLEIGPAPVRTIAVKTGINRGTAYEILKSLIDLGLVSYFHKTRHQHFAAEHPSKLESLIDMRTQELTTTKQELADILPHFNNNGAESRGQPKVRFFEGTRGIRTMLEDVLATMAEEQKKEYYVYSSADVRKYLYVGFRDFANKRIKGGIKVKTIAIGSGGKLWGLDERRWLTGSEHAPSYQIIYAGKLALISLNDHGQPVGALVEDARIAQTQSIIFEKLFASLPAST